MDSDLIYAKTASGEEAMQKRTRVMQRNVRMVLILVDGQSTVADLCLKTGNQKLTENALIELEKGGLIELRIEQDSLWEESKKVAQEIRAAAMSKVLPAAAVTSNERTVIHLPDMIEERVFVHSDFPVPARDPSNMQISLTPLQQIRISQSEENVSGNPRASINDASGAIAIERTRKYSQEATEEKASKPIRHGSRSSMNLLSIIFSGVVGVVALLFLTVFFFPYSNYLPEVEAAFSQASGYPVKVGEMRVQVYPSPGLFLKDVHFGASNEEMRIAEMRLLPELGSITTSKVIFRELVLNGTTLPVEFVAGLSGAFERASKETSKVGVRHVSFENTSVSFDGLVLSALDGEAKLTADGNLLGLSLRTQDRSLMLKTEQVEKALNVFIEGYAWRPSQKAPLVFDSINLKARLENGALAISSMDLRVFDGLIQGVATFQSVNRPRVSGDIQFERINASRLGEALSIGQQFSGETSGKLHFSSMSDSWDSVFSGIYAEGDFVIRRGSIRGIDLAEAVRRISAVPVQGGSTVFEQLSGKLKWVPDSYQFLGLNMNSGLMQSTGFLQISDDLNISGNMELRMRGSANQTHVPVKISGPLKSPSVKAGGR